MERSTQVPNNQLHTTLPPPAPSVVVDLEIVRDTIRVVTEGVCFAWRVTRSYPPGYPERYRIRNGVWWNPSGSRVISLAVGDILHIGPGPHYETMAFAPPDVPDDICNHSSFEEAEACALLAMRTGRWCYPSSE